MGEVNNTEMMTAEERAVLSQLAGGEPPYNQRAQALLALADGATQAEAAAQTNLTPNQVRYWLGRFRTGRLKVFPEDLTTAGAAPETAIEVNIRVKPEAEPVATAALTAESATEEGEVSESKKRSAKKKKKAGAKKKAKSKDKEKSKKKKGKSKKKKGKKKGGKKKGKGKKKKKKAREKRKKAR